jgi:hypothetical protein
MNMSEHTPVRADRYLPWTFNPQDGSIRNAKGEYLAQIVWPEFSDPPYPELALDDMRFLVRAANCHDALLESLRNAAAYLHQAAVLLGPRPEAAWFMRHHADTTAAIAKAEVSP